MAATNQERQLSQTNRFGDKYSWAGLTKISKCISSNSVVKMYRLMGWAPHRFLVITTFCLVPSSCEINKVGDMLASSSSVYSTWLSADISASRL